MSDHLDVRKTPKLYIGGAFVRSESGRTYPVPARPGGAAATPGSLESLENVVLASRKDARDAVVAARGAFPRWTGATAYLRGQVTYRIAEMLESRRSEFTRLVASAEGVSPRAARRLVDRSIDRVVWYAGWADKFAQVAGSSNPVAGPYFNFSVPEPTGVVAVLAPQDSSLLGLVSVVCPLIVTGNTVVVVASERRPLPAVGFSEVLATSDVPAGVVNVLTGATDELAPVLASHMDVHGMDVSGASPQARPELERLAATNVKRLAYFDEDFTKAPSLARLRAFVEIKTVWHPVGV